MAGVTTEHKDYAKHSPTWAKCRDAVEGEDAIKAKREMYLPRLTGQSLAEYNAYLQRAMFYGASSRTVQGLVGAIFRKPPQIECGKDLEDRLKSIGGDGESIEQIGRDVAREQLETARVGILLDAEEASLGKNAEPFLEVFPTEAITNWRCGVVNGREQLVLVVLKESYHESTSPDGFEVKEAPQYRVFRLMATDTQKPYCQVEKWRQTGELDVNSGSKVWIMVGEPVILKMWGGRTVPFIPICLGGPEGIGDDCEKPPILDLVNVNLSHYRTSADLEHGRHFTCLPQVWIAGAGSNTGVMTIGSAVAWMFEEPHAKADYLEFSGEGLKHLSEALKEKQQLMAVQGARLLEEQKKVGEAADTVRLRQAGERSVLANIAQSTGDMLQRCLSWVALWMSASPDEVVVTMNQDFDSMAMDGPTMASLMAMAQGGLISWDSFFFNLKRGEVIPDERTAEEERALIEDGPPMGVPTSPDGAIPPKGAPTGAKGGTKPTTPKDGTTRA